MNKQMQRLYEAARELKGIEGQSDLSRAMNTSPQVINNWEARGISKSGLLNAEKIFGCSAIWLETGGGVMCSTASRHIEENPKTFPAEIQAVIQMMEETDAEGRILAKHAVTDALKKYRGNQEPSRPGAIPPDIYEAMAGESDDIMYEAVRAALDSVGKLHKLKKQM